MNKTFDKHQRTWIIAGTIIIVALIAMYTVFQLSPSQTISVNGQSQLDVTPDQITMGFLIQSVANTATEAQDANTETYNSFVLSVNNLNIDEKEIKTTNLNVQKNYEWINGKRVDKGYIATHSIEIKLSVDEKATVTKLIDSGVDSGALISYINFELSDSLKESKKEEAIQKATEDAKSKAESIAEGLDAKLGSIVSVSDSNTYYNPPYVYYAEDSVSTDAKTAGESAQAAVAEINPSEQTIQANIKIVYKVH